MSIYGGAVLASIHIDLYWDTLWILQSIRSHSDTVVEVLNSGAPSRTHVVGVETRRNFGHMPCIPQSTSSCTLDGLGDGAVRDEGKRDQILFRTQRFVFNLISATHCMCLIQISAGVHPYMLQNRLYRAGRFCEFA